MLFKQADKITFVMYQEQKVGRAFQFNKRKLKLITLSISLLFFLTLLTTFLLLAQVRYNASAQTEEKSRILSRFMPQHKKLKDELAEMKKLNAQYLKRISIAPTKREAILPLFGLPSGYEDLTGNKWLRVEDIEVKFQADRVLFEFNIINAKQDGTKLFGHIFIAMGHGSQLSLYPNAPIAFDQTLTAFGQGETFAISRLRPVKGRFNVALKKGSSATFKIYIFSRGGDILYHETTDPMEVTIP